MTQTTLVKLMSEREKNRKSSYHLRCLLKNTKQDLLKMKTSFVLQKAMLQKQIRELKKKIKKMKYTLKYFVDDDDFTVDPKTGVIDMTQPKTPSKPKRVSCKKK